MKKKKDKSLEKNLNKQLKKKPKENQSFLDKSHACEYLFSQ